MVEAEMLPYSFVSLPLFNYIPIPLYAQSSKADDLILNSGCFFLLGPSVMSMDTLGSPNSENAPGVW